MFGKKGYVVVVVVVPFIFSDMIVTKLENADIKLNEPALDWSTRM